MTSAALASIGSAWLLGLLAVSVVWPRARAWRGSLPVILPLGLGLGLGITSALFFAASLFSAKPGGVSAGLELVTGIGLAWSCWRRPPSTKPGPNHFAAENFWLIAMVGSVFAQALIVASVASARAYAAEPLGSWDGWAIWNLHARIIFRGGEGWTALLHAPQVAWTHPDYPLLVPASVARGWTWVGNEDPFASALVSGMFGLATVGLLIAAVAQLRTRWVALTGGLLLLGTPFFVTFASNEHADIPLGFFMLATLALMTLSRDEPDSMGLLVLAGFAAGLAAWTKNEGMMFAIVASLGWGIYSLKPGRRRNALGFLGGLAVALLPVLYFKIRLAPPNDVVSGELTHRLSRLLEGARHRLILASFARDLMRFGEWQVAPFLAMALPLLGSGWRRLQGREWLTAAILVSMFLGYYCVYLLTPWDLAWHLDFSLVRLLLQLWPAAVFFWCLAVTLPEISFSTAPASPRGFPRKATVALIFGVNVIAAGMELTALNGQCAANEFDLARIEGGDVSAIVGEGWFERETDGRSVWVWSKGESVLLIRVGPRPRPVAVTVHFGLRGLGVRTVTAQWGERVIWRAKIGEAMTRVELPLVALSPGVNRIVFVTDAPGVPESADPKARALSFALYDVRLK